MGSGLAATFTRRRLLLMAGIATRVRANGTDFWNRKPPAEWNAGDIYQLANHSPWANLVRSSAPIRDYGAPRSGRRGAAPDLAPPPVEAGPQGVVTWESALPLRQALKAPLPGDFAECYVIGVDGIPLGDTRSLEVVRELTWLRSRGKVKWTVRAQVVRELIRNSVVYAFGFPKSAAPIDADTAEVYFESQFGRWLVQTRFRPRDMLYRGQVAV